MHKPQAPDRELEEKIRAEWPAILAWMIGGTTDWLAGGLTRPEVVVEATSEYFSEQDSSNGQADSTLRLQLPSDGAISCMEEAFGWSTWLEPIDSKVVWMRASGRRWKAICWAVGLRRAAAHEHRLFALCVIAWRLNGRRGLPRRVSKRRFIGQVYRASPAPMPTYVLSHLG
jgi:hypothetical protein